MATGPRVEIGADGLPVYIETVSDDVLRTIKPTGDDIDQLYKYRKIHGLDDTFKTREFERQYLQRFNITPDNPRYDEAIEQLATESNSKKVATAQARRAAQRTQTIEALGGKVDKMCIYINDGPEPCDECAALNGIEMKYSEFIDSGQAPGDVCLGGDNCLCLLQPIG